MASSSGSGLTFKLHPLVIVNISDHYTRVKSQSIPPQSAGDVSSPLPPPPRVFGCVIGIQRGRTVEIFNSFELLYDPSTHSLDRPFLEKKQELCVYLFLFFYFLRYFSLLFSVLKNYLELMCDCDEQIRKCFRIFIFWVGIQRVTMR